jgi:hypothetical protein
VTARYVGCSGPRWKRYANYWLKTNLEIKIMANDFERILDECIDRLGRGESLEACLRHYPEHAKQLEPLLRAMAQTKAAYSFTPSVDAKREARQRFYAEMERRRQPSLWHRMFARRLVWATLATVLVLSIISYAALRATVFPVELPSITVPSPTADGNFVFLVSDEVNAIDEFSSLNVTISKVGLLQSGSSKQWVQFVPEVKEFDLTLLPREKTQQLWRGNVPEGQYTKVVIYVTHVQGIPKATAEAVGIKLPSDKLQISKTFQVSTDSITSFTYDLTVINTGNATGGGEYLLKPQADQSGAAQKPNENKGEGQKDLKK